MILNVSGRTDVVAFYTDWFMNRYKEGFVDVRNPFNKKLVSRIFFEDVDAILFCTKNPIPIVDKLKLINKPIVFHITITPYKKDIEPNVPDKSKVIEAVKKISEILGTENVVVRYDPIFISDEYSINYHIKAFSKLCSELDGYIKKITVSFIDDYKNVRNNYDVLKYREFSNSDYALIGTNFSSIAESHNIKVSTCFEDNTLVEYGFTKDECMSKELAYKLTGKVFKSEWTARKERKCHCVLMVDIGWYNTCPHMCKYCYANYDEKMVDENIKKHDKNSSLLIGKVESDDIIKRRLK